METKESRDKISEEGSIEEKEILAEFNKEAKEGNEVKFTINGKDSVKTNGNYFNN